MLHALLFVFLGSIIARLGWSIGHKVLYFVNQLVGKINTNLALKEKEYRYYRGAHVPLELHDKITNILREYYERELKQAKELVKQEVKTFNE